MLEELNEPNELNEPVTDGANNVPTPDELTALKAQLEEEQTVAAEVRAQLTARDERIAALEGQLSEVQEAASEGRAQAQELAAQLERANETHAEAINHYLNAQRALNPVLPEGVIRGNTIKEVDDSVSEALSIALAVKEKVEAEAKNARVPAGAPTRAVDMDALTPGEKIKVGLSHEKGGTS